MFLIFYLDGILGAFPGDDAADQPSHSVPRPCILIDTISSSCWYCIFSGDVLVLLSAVPVPK